MKKIELLNYHVVLLFKVFQNIALNKKDRAMRKGLFKIFEKTAGVINESVSKLKEEHKDRTKFNDEYNKLLNGKVSIDIIPSDEVELPIIAEFIKNMDVPLTSQDETVIEYVADVLEGKEVKKEEVK